MAAVLLAASMVMGCTHTTGQGAVDPVTAYFGPGGAAIPMVAEPPGRLATTAMETAALLLGQFPRTAVGVPAVDLAKARDVVIRALSKLHGDHAWVCGVATGKDPVEAEFPPGTKWVRDPKQDPFRKHHSLYQLPGCDQARLTGVYVGEQQFSVARDGADIRIDHVGVFTDDLRALGNGVRLPVHVAAQRRFIVRRYPDGYHIVKLINTFTQAAPGVGTSLPAYTGDVPGLQLANQIGTVDPAATTAIRAALVSTIAAGSAKVSFEDRSAAPWRDRTPDLRSGQFWPQDGAAEYRYAVPAGKVARYGVREFVIHQLGDYNEYNVPDPEGRKYSQWDPRLVPEVAGIPADSNPFVALAILSQLDAASGTACQSADRSETCYVVRIPVSRLAVTSSLTSRVGHAYGSYGATFLTLKVGLSQQRLSMISQDAILPVVGHGVLSVHWRFAFSDYAAASTPPKLVAPPASQVQPIS